MATLNVKIICQKFQHHWKHCSEVSLSSAHFPSVLICEFICRSVDYVLRASFPWLGVLKFYSTFPDSVEWAVQASAGGVNFNNSVKDRGYIFSEIINRNANVAESVSTTLEYSSSAETKRTISFVYFREKSPVFGLDGKTEHDKARVRMKIN